MTNKEAIEILLDMANELQLIPESKQGQAFKIAIEALKFDIDQYCKEHFVVMVDEDVWDKAEKALEQEPILDKIRTEINEEYRDESEHPYGQGLRRALQIIDKYKTESEENNGR